MSITPFVTMYMVDLVLLKFLLLRMVVVFNEVLQDLLML